MPTSHPTVVQLALKNMSEDQRLSFEHEFQSRKRSAFPMVLLAIFFPIQMFFLNRLGLGLVFIFTLGGLFIWWIIEIFLTPGRVRDHNREVATEVARDLKIMAN